MKIIMTGSHGFVGTNLIDTFGTTYQIIRWNAREDNPLPECDAVIHLAGLAHDTKNVNQPDMYFEINTELTKKIFKFFLESKARKFIFFSSIKAKDNDTPYAKSKYQAEEYILAHNSNINKRTYILRPCMIHGKGVKGNLPLLFKYVKKGWPWPLAAFENKRSYVSMGNLCFVVEQLLKKDVESGTYNICDDEPVSTNDLIMLMSACLGQKCSLLKIPKGLVQMGAKLGDILHLPLNTERLRKLTENLEIDNSDIKHAIEIRMMPIKAMDGLTTTINGIINHD